MFLQGSKEPTISNNDEMIIFAGYSGIGWDLYSISNPNKLEHKVVQPTNFIKNKSPDGEKIVDLRRHKSVKNFEEKMIIQIGFLLKAINILIII